MSIGKSTESARDFLHLVLAELTDWGAIEPQLKDAAKLIEGRDARIRAEARAEALRERWISVEDRLPEIGKKVLAYRPTAHLHADSPITNCIYTGQINRSWEGVEHGFDRINHPTHWMPLPEPPAILADEPKEERGAEPELGDLVACRSQDNAGYLAHRWPGGLAPDCYVVLMRRAEVEAIISRGGI